MFRFTRTSLWASRRRLLGTTLAIVLGIAFLAGTFVTGDSVRARFDSAFTEANAGVDVLVRDATTVGNEMSSQRRPVAPEVVDTVAQLDGVAGAFPTIEGVAQIVGADGSVVGADGPPTVGESWIDDAQVNPWRLDDGRAPVASGEVVIDRASADAGNLEVGSRTTVNTPAPVEVEIVGIARYGDADSLGPTTYTAFTPDDARRYLLGGQQGSTGVIVVAEPGIDDAQLAQRVTAALPSGIEALTNAELTAEMNADIEADFVGLVDTFLMIFAGVALVVATFSIYNTFSIVVAQRSRESAMLRAVGASRRQIVASVLVESLAVGVVASAVGCVVGIGLSAGLFSLFESMGFPMPGDGLTVAASSMAVAMAVGTAVTLVASVGPALRASRIPPVAALREASIDATHTSRVRVVVGALTAVVGLGLLVVGGTRGSLPALGVGVVLALAGTIALGPVAVNVATPVIAAPLRRLRGVVGALAADNARRNPRRTAATSAALMVGITIVVAFTVFAATMRTFIDDSVDASVDADLVVSMSTFGGSGLSPELVTAIDDLPEVSQAAGLGLGAAMLDGTNREVTVVEPAVLAEVFDADVTEGSIAKLPADGVAVSSFTAAQRGWELGSRVDVEFVDGTSETLTVGALFERREILGEIVVPASTYEPHSIQHTNMLVLVGLDDGVSTEAGRAAVEDAVRPFGAPPVETAAEFVETASAEVDMILTVVYAMLALAILIALLGIANTLALSVHERTRELGLLRAVGQYRSQLRAMVRWESVVIAVFGTLGGVGLGLLAGWAAVGAIGSAEELPLRFAMPTTQLAVIVVVGAVAGLVASLRPAWRASRLDVLEAIATE